MNPQTSPMKFPFVTTGTKAALFLLKNRIKAPRVVPAPSTGDPASDDATRREFERVSAQLNADYQDQRAMLNDLEPLLCELAEQIQNWMVYRDEQHMNLMFMALRNQNALPQNALPAAGASTTSPVVGAPTPGTPASADFLGGQTGSAYEGQLLRGDGTNPVYKIENGRKRWIVSQQVFERLGYSFSNVRVVPPQLIDSIPFGANIT